jgi:hypothetical protein
MSVVEAVEREVEALGPKAQASPLAATALAVARRLDDPGTSSTSVSMCAKAMVDVLRELWILVPPREENDDLSRLREEREARLARGAAAADPARP